MQALQLDDIQGILLFGYGRLRSASYLLLRIAEPSTAKAWLSSLDVRSANFDPSVTDRCINVAFTPGGLARLGLPASLIGGFAPEFTQGMTGTDHRTRILGDVGDSSPDRWRWGGPNNPEPHVLLMLYGKDDETLATLLAEQRAAFRGNGLDELTVLETHWLAKGTEHFGFRDGVSTTDIEGFHTKARPENSVAAGEFILGYVNAYGQYTQRPLVTPDEDPRNLLPSAPDVPGHCDLGGNGSYMVFRQLSQDVGAFWKFMDEHTRAPDDPPSAESQVRLASKMVGRWPSGAPLVKTPDADNPALCDDNDFLYHRAGDELGLKCPIGSHIRRANPRDALDPEPGSDRSIEVGKRHRVVRRGRPYGAPVCESMEIADVLAHRETPGERGLHFICFNTQIGRQFEFIQHTWLNSPKFDGLCEDDDPLAGDRGGGRNTSCGTFTVQAEPVRTRFTGMPRVSHVRGGAYFFLPGIRAVRYLASLP